jgi:UPF0755 protein
VSPGTLVMTNKKQRSPFLACSLVLVFIICMGVFVASLALSSLPRQAVAAFGPADPALGVVQRTYLSAWLLLNKNDVTLPANPILDKQPFQVELGEAPASIAGRLQGTGLINNPAAFLNYLRYSGLDKSLQAGQYTLSGSLTPLQIARAMQDATPTEVTFQVFPGWRVEEIAASLPTSGLVIPPEAFLAAVDTPPAGYSVTSELPPKATLEGFLFPGAYRLPRTTTADELINQLLKEFDAHVSPELRAGFQHQGLSLYEAVTLASMIEREAVVHEEMPLIASVFLNRLAYGMNLASDPTVQYALGYNSQQRTWWTNPLSLDDLKINSPYNTYTRPGLPPSPISNPGVDALRAVAFPAQTPYYYFRAACDGSGRHTFARTFNEQIQNACP